MKYKIKTIQDLRDIEKKCDTRIIKARHIMSDLNDLIQYSKNNIIIESLRFDTCDSETSLIVKLKLKEMSSSDLISLISEKRDRLIIKNIMPINGIYSIFFDYNDYWI